MANASAVIYNALLAFPSHFGPNERAVNWCGASHILVLCEGSLLRNLCFIGFYLDSTLFPRPRISRAQPLSNGYASSKLLLGPFCGKPACQFINTTPGKARGVCADAFMQRRTALVPDVEAYPGHIACDGETKSEIVCPLLLHRDGEEDAVLGVLDLDCLALGGFDEEDQTGLERIAELVVKACDW